MGMNVTISLVLLPIALILIGSLGWLLFRQGKKHRSEMLKLHESLLKVEKASEMDRKYLEAMSRASQCFAEASDEDEIINFVLNLSMELTGSLGASFVPLDERSQPLAAIRQGEFPMPIPDAWLEYLASPDIRQTCQECNHHHSLMKTCPLLNGLYVEAFGIYCLPVRYGRRDVGILNLYLSDQQILTETSHFVRSLLDTTALALEGLRLQKQEWTTVGQQRLFRDRVDIKSSLVDLLNEIYRALDADYAIMMLDESYPKKQSEGICFDDLITAGQLPDDDREQVISWIEDVYTSGDPIINSDTSNGKIFASQAVGIMAVPIVSHRKPPHGVILIGKVPMGAFQKRQLSLLMAVAGQVSLIVQTKSQIALHEYQAMMNERSRLAREIHDGLAQTLGLLKLQVAQMHGFLERGETERLKKMIATNYKTLGDAYADVREAIDGLRHTFLGGDDLPNPNIRDWLLPVVNEFQESIDQDNLKISVTVDDEIFKLFPEAHAQLIRIVQEALSNIRKHANAGQVWINCRYLDHNLILEIIDDGVGFSSDNFTGPSHHGLRGMRERAELIGADFQIISLPEQGTSVKIRLPLSEQWMEAQES